MNKGSTPQQDASSVCMYSGGMFKGRVIGNKPLTVAFGEGEQRAALCAAGQVFELCAGDEVLIAVLGQQAWVLQILELADSPSREFTVHGATSIRMLAEHIEVKAGSLHVQSTRSLFRMGVMQVTAQSITAACQKISTWTRNWFLRSHVLATRSNQRISRIDAVDVVRAQEVDVQVSGIHAVVAQEARVTAAGNVSVHGSKVLLG